MKNSLRLLIVFLLFISFSACNTPDKTQSDLAPKKENLVDLKDGFYKEWYPGRKQIKYEGQLNKAGNREGKWNFYSEKGNLQSFTMFVDGKKEGHSLVKYPNGKIHYYGEYRNDQMVGEWVNYDQNGKKTVKIYE